MNSSFLILLASILLVTLIPITVEAMPATSEPVTTTQPDGTEIQVTLHGDWWYHFYRDRDGYAIVQDPDQWWVLADLDQDGRYRPTTVRIGLSDRDENALRSLIGPGLREDPRHWTARRELFLSETLPSILEQAQLLNPRVPVTINVPVAIIQYTDFFASQTQASFDDMMNQPGYDGTGSFNDYFEEISYGDLTVNATVFGWYTSTNNRNFYRHGAGTIVEINNARQLVRNAVDAAEFTGGANWVPFDNDLDGNVDIVFIVHQGPGAECGNLNFIWSHHWYLNAGGSNFSVNYDGKLIDRYIIMPEISCGGNHIEIGVFCHEFGHALGLPDLYDTDNSSEGIGNWGLMGGGGWGGNGVSPETPTHMAAWSKVQQGWVTPTVVAVDQTGVTINDVETNREIYQLWTNGMPANEYFLVENRQLTGFDQNLPTGGLAIWHIDDSQTGNTNEAHKLVDLEEADGLADLDGNVNRGDAGDLFPGSTGVTDFNDSTNPNSDDYAMAPSHVCVDNISASAATMSADFCVEQGIPPNLLIRDCAADVGNEPDAACAGNWVQSLDIWIDNNDDGVIDAPIQGVVNHLYIRAWNLGGPDVNANIKCWFVNPSLGLNFGMGSPGTQITDAVSFASQIDIPSINNLNPSPGGIGYRDYFNWMIPTPPPSIDHYCIGCVIESAADPQSSPVPLQENNLGQINYWALALKAGTAPAALADDDTTITVFRENIDIVNSFDEPMGYLIVAEGLEQDFRISPGAEVEIFLQDGETQTVTFDIYKDNSQHLDEGRVIYQLYKLPDFELVGGLIHDLYIDSYAPSEVREWSVEYFRPQGDDYPRPSPRYVVNWWMPEEDVIGAPERVRYYEIHAAHDPGQLEQPNEETLVAKTGADADPGREGFQYHFYAMDDEDMYFTMRAIDLAGNVGVAAPVLTAEVPVSSANHVPGATALLQNQPNPFNPVTAIWFRLDRPQQVSLSVYDLKGKRITQLTDQVFAAGVHAVDWNGRDSGGRMVAAGTYVVTLSTEDRMETRKISLVK